MESHSGLIERIAARDESALDRLMSEARYLVRTVFARYGVSGSGGHTHDDLSQEVWIKVWNGAHTFLSGSDEAAWVYGIAKNVAYDHLRRSNRRKRLIAAVDLPVEECATYDDRSYETVDALLAIAKKRCGKIYLDVLDGLISGASREDLMRDADIHTDTTYRWRLAVMRHTIKESPEFSSAFGQ